MSLIKCPKCGEMFSDSYKTCPFCEEDEAYYSGKLRKSRGRRAAESHGRHLRGELCQRDAPVRNASLRHVLHRLYDLLKRRLDFCPIIGALFHGQIARL